MLVEKFLFPDDHEEEVFDLIVNDEVKYSKFVSVELITVIEDL